MKDERVCHPVNAYTDGNSTVLLYRKQGVLMKRALRAEYVSYHRFPMNEGKLRTLKGSRGVTGVKQEGDWLRVSWVNYDVRKRTCDKKGWFDREGLETFEADVGPTRRFFSDTGANIAKPLRAYLDIETDSRVNPRMAAEGHARVLCWTIIGEDRKRTTGVLDLDTDDDERRLLEDFWKACEPYDQLLAWYGDGFDFPALRNRSEKLRVRVKDTRRWLFLDHLALFKRMNLNSAESGAEKQSMKLQDIAMALLGRGKNAFDAGKTWEAWEAGGKSRDELVEYNIQDTALLPEIEDKTGYVALFQTLCEVCRVLPESYSLHPTTQVDGFMLRMGVERGLHFPTRHRIPDEDVVQYGGAYVMEPRVNGITLDVHVCDFAAMYPSIILSWNMSPETKRLADGTTLIDPVTRAPKPEHTCRAPTTGVFFSTDQGGILVDALREMLRLRKFWSEKKANLTPGTPEWVDADRRSMAYKVAANSFYGVVGSPFSRYFDSEIAESVSLTGVWLLHQTIKAAEDRGYTVVYADTDSAFIGSVSNEEFTEFVAWCNTQLYPRLLKECGCKENHVKLAYEKKFRRIVFTSAKRYVGWYEHYKGKASTKDSKPEIKGLEWKRGDVSFLARKLQGEVIDMLRDTDEVDEYLPMIEKMRGYILEGSLKYEEILIAKSLSKPLKEYVTKTKKDGAAGASLPHVSVAKILQERGHDVSMGTRVEYVVTDASKSPLKYIPGVDYAGECDRFYLWERLVWPASERLLAGAFPENDWKPYGKARPPKVKAPRAPARKKLLQGVLPFDPPQAPPKASEALHGAPGPTANRIAGRRRLVKAGTAA